MARHETWGWGWGCGLQRDRARADRGVKQFSCPAATPQIIVMCTFDITFLKTPPPLAPSAWGAAWLSGALLLSAVRINSFNLNLT